MGWHGPRGNCGCCGAFACDGCDGVTTVSVSGVTDPAECAGGCTLVEGTYVFRTVGSEFNTCGWFWLLNSNNCGNNDDPLIYIGGLSTGVGACGVAFGNRMTVEFIPVTGGVRAQVTIRLQYSFDAYATGGLPTTKSSLFTYIWYDDFTTCADSIGVPLTLRSATESACFGGGTGDYCNLGVAQVVLG